MRFYEGIILQDTAASGSMDVYLTHGHQTDLFNSTLWRISRFLVRYLWKPLERYGVLDPTSAAKNYTRRDKAEQRLHHWAKQENHILIKWALETRPDMSLYVAREILAGPADLQSPPSNNIIRIGSNRSFL